MSEVNQSVGNEVMRITVAANPNQSVNSSNTFHIDAALLSQLFQMDSTLLQQIQSQGFIITSDTEENAFRNTDNNDVTQIF